MDELSEKLERVLTIIKFIFFGPFVLFFSIPVDTFVFFYNLYTMPKEASLPFQFDKISQKAMDIFQQECTDYLREYRKETGSSDSRVPFVNLNKRL